MKRPSFVECICTLQNTFLRHNKKESIDYGKDFWYVLNALPDDELVLWGERLIKRKGILQGKAYTQMCDILHIYKNEKDFWSVKQKRWMAMMLITHWDDISLYYEY